MSSEFQDSVSAGPVKILTDPVDILVGTFDDGTGDGSWAGMGQGAVEEEAAKEVQAWFRRRGGNEEAKERMR